MSGPWGASSNQIIFDPSTTHNPKVDGWLAGLQAGFNWQSGAWVYGIGDDIQITGAKEWKFPWFGTLRGRLGFLPTDRWLLYVTGGLAVGEAKYNMTFSQPGAVRLFNPYSLSDDVTRAGWTVGGGVETALDNNWSAKLEYLYVDLGTRSIDAFDVDGAPFHVEYKIRSNIVRVGLNYKFR